VDISGDNNFLPHVLGQDLELIHVCFQLKLDAANFVVDSWHCDEASQHGSHAENDTRSTG
jgi:hypothetical protein